jgi:hypothetical protein
MMDMEGFSRMGLSTGLGGVNGTVRAHFISGLNHSTRHTDCTKGKYHVNTLDTKSVLLLVDVRFLNHRIGIDESLSTGYRGGSLSAGVLD